MSDKELAEQLVVAFLRAADIAALAAASVRSLASGGGIVWSRRETHLHIGSARQLQVQAGLDQEASRAQSREEHEDWVRVSDLLREGGWSSDD